MPQEIKLKVVESIQANLYKMLEPKDTKGDIRYAQSPD